MPRIVVDMEGVASLRVEYSSAAPVNGVPKGDLPSLTSLREEAADLGVDISDLGRAKIEIIRRLQEARGR